MRWMLLLFLVQLGSCATPMPPIDRGSVIVWQYQTDDVEYFEASWDDGPFVGVGMQTHPESLHSYAAVIPDLPPGEHSVVIRACNVDGCSDGADPVVFTL